MNKFDAGYPPRHRMLINVYVRQQLKYWTVFDLLDSRIDLDRAVIWSFQGFIKERRDLEVNAPGVCWKIRNREVQIKFQILIASHWRIFRKPKFSTVRGQYMQRNGPSSLFAIHPIWSLMQFWSSARQLLYRSSMKLENSRPQMNFDSLNWFPKIPSYYKVDVVNVSEASELAGIWGYPDCITAR